MDEIYFSMAEASKTCPDLTETTGLAGEVPLKAQNMKVCGYKARRCASRVKNFRNISPQIPSNRGE